MTDPQFLLSALALGAAVWAAAVLWNRWDLKRAIRKELRNMLEQEARLRRLTGGG